MNKLNSKRMVNYDVENDVLYFCIKKGVEEEFVEISPGINVELDKDKKVIGIEVLDASRVLKPVQYASETDITTTEVIASNMGNRIQTKITYEPEADVLMDEITDKPIDYAKEIGNFVVHFSHDNTPVLFEIFRSQ